MKLDKYDQKLNTHGSRIKKHGTANRSSCFGVRAAYRALRKRARRVGFARAIDDN